MEGAERIKDPDIDLSKMSIPFFNVSSHSSEAHMTEWMHQALVNLTKWKFCPICGLYLKRPADSKGWAGRVNL